MSEHRDRKGGGKIKEQEREGKSGTHPLKASKFVMWKRRGERRKGGQAIELGTREEGQKHEDGDTKFSDRKE